MTGLFVAVLVGWLCLFALVLAAAAARRAGPRAPLPDAAPPAVIGLLARGPSMRLYQATLLDLAGRGWFRLRWPGPSGPPSRSGWPGQPGAAAGAAGPVLCELPAQHPRDDLTPYERRALAHVAFRAGAHHEVPAPALADGFADGDEAFLVGFRREVANDARDRGLSQPRLRAGTRALLCAAAVLPAAAAAAAIARHHPAGAWYALFGFVAACVVVTTLGAHEVPSRAGRAALAWHRSRVAQGARGAQAAVAPDRAPDRAAAAAAALGRSAAALAVFGPPGQDETWSSFGGPWRPLTLGSPMETSAVGMGALAYFVLMFPVLSVTGILGFAGGVHGVGGLALRACALAVAAGGLLLASRAIARSSRLPAFAEFDGQVIRRWIIQGDDDSPTYHCVAVDDGTSARAWAFAVAAAQYPALAPGTFVHVRINPRRNRPLSVQPTEPAPVAPRLAAVLADGQEAGENRLPDPAALVTEQEAAEVFGGPVRGTRFELLGRLLIWRPAAATRPSLQVMVQGGTLATRAAGQAARHGMPLPSADCWLLGGRSAVLRAGTLTARVTLTGVPPAAAEAALARLVPQVQQRLRAAASPAGTATRR
jgi:hypothetical protein